MPLWVGWLVIGVVALIDGVWLALSGRTIASPSIELVVAADLLVAAVLCRLWWPRIAGSLQGVAQNLCLVDVMLLFIYLCATAGFPLRDAWFLAADRALGFDWMYWYKAATSSYVTASTLFVFYGGFFFVQSTGLIFLLPFISVYRNTEIVFVLGLTSVTVALIAMFLPAVGAVFQLGIDPAPFHDPLVAARHSFNALRAGGPVIDFAQLNGGIVVFPSFHAVSAAVYSYAVRGSGQFFRFVVSANLLMLIAVPIIGGHYLVDVIGGLAVAAVAIKATRAVQKRFEQHNFVADVVREQAQPT